MRVHWGRAGNSATVEIAMLGGGGRPIRQIRAVLVEGQLVTLALPPGVERVQLGSTREDPRVRVELAQRSPRRSRTDAT